MTEDSSQGLKWFIQLCDTFKYNGVTGDVILLRLFPFSLINNAFPWLDSHAPRLITTWDELAGKFLQNGLDVYSRLRLDGAAKGALMNRMYKDMYKLIKNMAMNSYHWLIERHTYGQRPSTMKARGDRPLFHYINNPNKDVNYIENKGKNPYSNTFNPRWRDHLNLIWRGNQGGGNTLNQKRANPNDHTVCGQRLDQIEREMQSMMMEAKQVQSECTNSTKNID
ncbi:myb-like protein D [Gossypium australe]|uniref:Myb-like protein D n=1 Tax=Gossypium australe TaxID=47621 RepID=A0A5B6X2E8_9ROSI|nr:myb-like protein D [Gossypium australe]